MFNKKKRKRINYDKRKEQVYTVALNLRLTAKATFKTHKLTWKLTQPTSQMSLGKQKAIIAKAFSFWTNASGLNMVEVPPTEDAIVDVR